MGSMAQKLSGALKGLDTKGRKEVWRNSDPTWPSAALHDLGSKMANGIDRRRLLGLAEYIEGVGYVTPQTSHGTKWAPGPVLPLEMHVVDGRLECIGYMLDGPGDGLGLQCLVDGKRKLYLTGYGLACWAWGRTNGMAALAEGVARQDLEDLLIAKPVKKGFVPGLARTAVTAFHVAQALRYFAGHHEQDDIVQRAWDHAAEVAVERDRKLRQQEKVREAEEKVGLGEIAPAQVNAGGVSDPDAQWRVLLSQERYEEAVILCQEQIVALKRWQKRLNVARAGLEEE